MAEPEATIDEPSSQGPPNPPDASEPIHASKPATGFSSVGVFAIVVTLIIQVVLLGTVLATRSEVSDLRSEIEAGGGFPTLGSGPASPGPATSSAPAVGTPQVVATNLPRFVAGGTDTALGRNIGDVSATEYYSGQDTVFRAADGKARAFMVWAHWCPFCQEELPVMAEWHGENAAEFDGFELVSVTTAMDETASNPLLPYLDSNRFPFPVLFDADGGLARQLGVSAFPFWVFVAPDGTVVGRAAGGIDPDNLASVFEQLNELGIAQTGALAPSP